MINRASLTGGNCKKFQDWIKKPRHYESIDLSLVKAPPFSGAQSAIWAEKNDHLGG